MKIELIKETNLNEIIYTVEIDGSYVSGTASNNLETTKGYYEALKSGSPSKEKQIIESSTI